MVVPPKHPKMIVFSRKTLVVGYHHFRNPPYKHRFPQFGASEYSLWPLPFQGSLTVIFSGVKNTQLLSHSATPRSFRQQRGHQLAVLRRCLRHVIDGSLQVRMNCFDLPNVVVDWGLPSVWFPKCSIKIMCSTVCQKRHGLWEEGVSGSALHRLSEQLQGNLRVTQGCHNPPRNKALYTKRWLRP